MLLSCRVEPSTYSNTYLSILSVCLPAFLPACLPTYLPTFLPSHPPIHPSISSPACLPAYVRTYLPTYLPSHPSIHLFISLPACLPACPPTRQAACLSVYLSLDYSCYVDETFNGRFFLTDMSQSTVRVLMSMFSPPPPSCEGLMLAEPNVSPSFTHVARYAPAYTARFHSLHMACRVISVVPNIIT
jgi:hypothetical protein